MSWPRNPKNKFHAEKTEIDGHKFDSKAEAVRYQKLNLLQKAGIITDLTIHPRYILQSAFTTKYDQKVPMVRYTGDFQYTDQTGQIICEDVKGFLTSDALMRIRLARGKFPEIKFVILNEEELYARRRARDRKQAQRRTANNGG